MDAKTLKRLFLQFFETKGHAIIPSAPLIPDNDPTVLFTTAGMHPLIPYLLGQPHPLGKRLANVQKCLRTQDIDEVGDTTHTTCFEMLGNWSLGDYFKEQAIKWSWEFLTGDKWLNLSPQRLAITCFAGDDDAPKDEQAAQIWKELGVDERRIAFLPKSDNWWGPAGQTGPCGPDTEIFYWRYADRPAPDVFDPCDQGWVEIWNNVFMEYNKTEDGIYEPLAAKNVDTGMGVERVAMLLQGYSDIYQTELFAPLIDQIKGIADIDEPTDKQLHSLRVIADHMRAATFILGDERGVQPSNVDQGYILRRFIRRSIRHARLLGIHTDICVPLARSVIAVYHEEYPILKEHEQTILSELQKEEERFVNTLVKGLTEFTRITSKLKEHGQSTLSGRTAFLLFQSYGFPLEMTQEMATEHEMQVDVKEFEKEYHKHQELSRKGAEQKFKGGLADTSQRTVRLHTATHLLNEALRKVLDCSITQKGSNITPERLRFDFNFDRKLTDDELTAIEQEVNKIIAQSLPVSCHETTPQEAQQQGAQAEFGARYPPKVTVYSIGEYSKEICMGPHVANTRDIGVFRILKEESSAAGVRRIKATVE